MKFQKNVIIFFLLVLVGCSQSVPLPNQTQAVTSTSIPSPTITPSPTPVPRVEGVITRNTFLFDCSENNQSVAQLVRKDEKVILRGKFNEMGIVAEFGGNSVECGLIPLTDLKLQDVDLTSVSLSSVEHGNALVAISPENAQYLGEVFSIGKGLINKVVFSSDSKYLAATTPLGVYLYDGVNFEFTQFIETSSDFIGFSPNGNLMYTVAGANPSKKQIRVWNLANGSLSKTIEIGTFEIRSFFVSPDGNTFITAGSNGIVTWNSENGAQIKKITSNKESSFATFSHDGKYIATGMIGKIQLYTIDGTLVWDNEFTGKKWNPDQSQSTVPAISQNITFSPDDLTLTVTGGVYEGQFSEQITYQVSDGTQVRKYLGYPFAYSPNGQIQARNLCSIVCVKLEDLNFKAIAGLYDPNELFSDENPYSPASGALIDLNFSPDGKFLAAASGGGGIQVWEMENYSLIKEISGFSMPVRGLSVSPDGEIVLSVASTDRDWFDKRAEVALKYDVWNQTFSVLPNEKGGFVYDILYFPNGEYIATMVEEKADVKIYLVNPNDLTVSEKYPLANGIGADTLIASQNSSIFASSMLSPNRLYAWKVGNPLEKLIDVTWNSGNGAPDIALSPDGALLAMEEDSYANGVGEYKINLYDVARQKELAPILLQFGTGKFEFLPDSNKLVVVLENWEAGRDEIQVWNTSTQKLISNNPQDFDWDYKDIAISPDGRLLALTTLSGEIKIYSIESKVKLLSTLSGSTSEINKVVFSQDGRFLVSGGEDGLIKIWAIKP